MCWLRAWQKIFGKSLGIHQRERSVHGLTKCRSVTWAPAFFPFGDNIERAYKSGVKYIAQPGGSVRDDNVIDTCNKYGMVMAFTGIRLFHH